MSDTKRKVLLSSNEKPVEPEIEPIYLKLIEDRDKHGMQVRVVTKHGLPKAAGILATFCMSASNELIMKRVGSVGDTLNVLRDSSGRIFEERIS